MRKNIENYSKQIKDLGGFINAVRKLPGMYIGYKDKRGHLNMIREIYQNSIDQIMRNDSPATHIRLSFDENTNMCIVEDNGLGIPFDKMIEVFTVPHMGSNFDKKHGQFVSGLHGIGSKVTNALSKNFRVESYVLGKGKLIEFIDGVPTTENPVNIPNKKNKQGTLITFVPSSEVMEDLDLTVEEVYELVRNILSLTKIGTIVYFNGIKKNGKVIKDKIINEDGLLYSLILNTKKPLITPVMLSDESETMKADVCFTYDVEDMNDDIITSFSNFCPTKLGTHIKGFSDGIVKYFRNYMNNIYLSKRTKYKIMAGDIRTGLRGVVAVSHLNPIFTGQAKEELSNEDMGPYVRDMVFNGLESWSQTNPADLQKIAKYLKDIAEMRSKLDIDKIKLTANYASSILTGLPAQYTPPNGRKNLELLIVEGKSAGGSAKNARCKNRQGIMPIRGKIPNAMRTNRREFLENREIRGIINILGGGYGKNFDIEKIKFDKIIVGADADADGSHIHVLVLIFFLLYMTDLVIEGKLYKAVPPLYGIQHKRKMKYFVDRLDFIKYTQKTFFSNNDITTKSGVKLTSSDITDLLYKNMDYVYELETIANTYAIDPNLLQLVLNNRNKSFNDILKLVRKTFRFMDGELSNNIMIFTGLISSRFQTMFLNDKLLEDGKYIINYLDEINRNIIDFKLNNKLINLYNLLQAFNTNMGNITRFKGLGEMNEEQLAISTIHPDYDRTLIQYTVKDIKEEIATMERIQSNKSQLIENLQVSRQEIIG